jgi:hypothetical protein
VPLSVELLSGLDVALNEAHLHHVEVRVDRAAARVGLAVLTLPEVGPQPPLEDRIVWLYLRRRAAIPPELLTSRSIAVDGTDVESWGALQGASRQVDLDGEAAETQIIDDHQSVQPVKRRRVRTAKVFGLGEDGRKRYTKDPDARAEHRSATNQRLAGPYIGCELHLAVHARDVRWTNFIDNTSLEAEVAGVITTCTLVPAGTHRGKAIVEELIAASKEFHEIDDVVWDPGYSLCKPETTTHLLARSGIATTMQPVVHQRGIRPFAGEALSLDGQLFSPMLPAELRDLAMPPRGAPAPYRRAFEEAFNRRAAGVMSDTADLTPTGLRDGSALFVRDCSEVARCRDEQGRARSRTMRTKTEAQQYLERVGADIQRGDYIDPAERRRHFRDWSDIWWDTT